MPMPEMESRLIKLETRLDSHVQNYKEGNERSTKENQVLWEKLSDHQRSTAEELKAISIKLDQTEKSHNEKLDKFDTRINGKLDDLSEKLHNVSGPNTKLYSVVIVVMFSLLAYFMVEGVPWLHPDRYIKNYSERLSNDFERMGDKWKD